MTSGLEIKNESGSFQVTQETRVTAFLRKGTVDFESEQFLRKGIAKVPYDPLTEVFAFSCSEYVSVLYADSGNMVIGSSKEVSSSPVLSYWIFGKPNTVSNQGVQVYDGQGTELSNLLYDSSWIPIKPLEIIRDATVMPAGKNYAVVAMSVNSNTSRDYPYETVKPITFTRTDDAVKILANDISIQFTEVYKRVQISNNNTSDPYNFDISNFADTKYMVIDVTGL